MLATEGLARLYERSKAGETSKPCCGDESVAMWNEDVRWEMYVRGVRGE
jgi:hypothetical protein